MIKHLGLKWFTMLFEQWCEYEPTDFRMLVLSKGSK